MILDALNKTLNEARETMREQETGSDEYNRLYRVVRKLQDTIVFCETMLQGRF